MMQIPITGYASSMSASPGDTIDFSISGNGSRYRCEIVRCTRKGQPDEPIAMIADDAAFTMQPLNSGSYATANTGGPGFEPDIEITLSLSPSLPERGTKQAIVSWGGNFGLFMDGAGRLAFRSGNSHIVCPWPLERHQWYAVRAERVPATSTLRLEVTAKRPGGPSFESTAPLESLEAADTGLFCMAAMQGEFGASAFFDGKIARPKIASGALGVIADWDLSAYPARPAVADRGAGAHHLTLVNTPRRAVTGPDWTGSVLDYRMAPDQYDAIAFHHDDLTDAGWPSSLSWTVPEDAESGLYALQLRGDDGFDQIPFFVTPRRGASKAAIAFLAPTFSYLAYANEQHWWMMPDIKELTGGTLEEVLSPAEKWAGANGLISCYDRHVDASGCTHSSFRRPIVNLRPDYRHPYLRGPHQLSADVYAIDWLREQTQDFDVITDHELHKEGADLLEGYQLVMTGSHPEYVSREILDALESFQEAGGNIFYLGGNGFYAAATVFADQPHVLEIRRGHAGGAHWKSPPGEGHLAATGEPGGLWRLQGRAPQRLMGVGMASTCFTAGIGYERTPESQSPHLAWIFEGVADRNRIDAAGDLLGGPAGFEYDRIDIELGSPRETVCLATARFSPAVTEYTLNDNRWSGAPAENRSDVAIIERAGIGSVFSTGSVAWATCLFVDGGENDVARITRNVVARFARR